MSMQECTAKPHKHTTGQERLSHPSGCCFISVHAPLEHALDIGWQPSWHASRNSYKHTTGRQHSRPCKHTMAVACPAAQHCICPVPGHKLHKGATSGNKASTTANQGCNANDQYHSPWVAAPMSHSRGICQCCRCIGHLPCRLHGS